MKNYWHSSSTSNVLNATSSQEDGLSFKEATDRLERLGQNILPQEKPLSKLWLFLSQFNNPLMYILVVTIIISFFLKHYSDTIFIIVVLTMNAVLGFWQENKANQSLLALKKMVKVTARVLRDGNEKEINSQELVVGDIVILKSGDKVPADGRIIASRSLKINEASLTGEALAVDKKEDEGLSESTVLSERKNMVFMGTIVEEGTATLVIVATGLDTEIGQVVKLLKETKEQKTHLQKKVATLSLWLGAFIIFIVIIIITEGLITGKSFVDIFIVSLALAVAAIPEGLLAAITIILVLGLRRIAKQGGFVKKLASAETLGSVTVICTDKTGTLTQGKMQVSHILTSTKELLKSDIAYLSKNKDQNGVESHISALKIATLVNDAFVENPEAELQSWIVRGRPTDRALLLAGMGSGLNKQELEKQYPLIDQLDFESEYKFAAGLYRKNESYNSLYVIGAPEIIINKCTNLDIDGKKQKMSLEKDEKLFEKLEELTQKGLRVLACAHRDYSEKTKYKELPELCQGLSLVGFIALKDPLRPDARESILTTKKAGIRTVIVTGDHKLTAKAIALEIGLQAEDKNIIEGQEIEDITDEQLQEKAKYISIYARVSPKHKLRIVDALQSNGEIVAMLGDGVNDAPAIKTADVGVAVGSGTDVAKETADLILLNDNFKTILKAVEQGRIMFQNIRKVFVYVAADSFSELFLFLASMAVGLPLPLLPAQILWINLVEDGFPDTALTTEQEVEGVMEEKPRNPKESLLSKPIKLWMLAIFFITGITAFIAFLVFWKVTGDLDKTRTMIFVLMCVDSLIFAFCVRSFKKSIFRKDIFSNRYLVGGVGISFLLLVAAVYLPPFQTLLGTQPLAAISWVAILFISLIEILLIEFFKKKLFKA